MKKIYEEPEMIVYTYPKEDVICESPANAIDNDIDDGTFAN